MQKNNHPYLITWILLQNVLQLGGLARRGHLWKAPALQGFLINVDWLNADPLQSLLYRCSGKLRAIFCSNGKQGFH